MVNKKDGDRGIKRDKGDARMFGETRAVEECRVFGKAMIFNDVGNLPLHHFSSA